jgi:deoxyadenosine/deoxycytidine kinase
MKIYLEANIGAGKSTLIKNLSENTFNTFNTKFIPEPLNDWEKLKDSNGTNILEHFYNDQTKWAFPFQMNSFISRANKLDNIDAEILVSERSVFTDRYCFAQNCFDTKKMNQIEWDIYSNWHSWLVDKFNLKADAYIYLNTNPEKCFERIKNRNRNGESDIPLDYLKLLHKKHDDWLSNETVPILMVDGDCELNSSKYYANIDNIKEFIETIGVQKYGVPK